MRRPRKKKARHTGRVDRAVIGVAWYSPDQWERLREVSSDADQLEDTYEEWRKSAEKLVERLQAAGANVVKAPVDIVELVAWCREEGRPVDAQARAEFVAVPRASGRDGGRDGGRDRIGC